METAAGCSVHVRSQKKAKLIWMRCLVFGACLMCFAQIHRQALSDTNLDRGGFSKWSACEGVAKGPRHSVQIQRATWQFQNSHCARKVFEVLEGSRLRLPAEWTRLRTQDVRPSETLTRDDRMGDCGTPRITGFKRSHWLRSGRALCAWSCVETIPWKRSPMFRKG